MSARLLDKLSGRSGARGYDCALMKPCKLSAALISMPRRQGGLDLDKLSKKLGENGYVVRIVTDKILIVRNEDGLETSVYPTGKLLFKTREIDSAKAECERLAALIK